MFKTFSSLIYGGVGQAHPMTDKITSVVSTLTQTAYTHNSNIPCYK